MNITEEKKDDLNMTLTVDITPDDYEEDVQKVLQDYKKKVTLKGFRPGKVPFGLVKKMYGKGVIAEEVNKKFSEAVSKYIIDNKLDILGEPLPVEDEQPIDFEQQEEFNLKVELALAPEFEVELSAKTKIPYYTIKIDDKLLKEYIDGYRQQLGELQDADSIKGEEYLKGTLTEVSAEGNPEPEGISVEDASISLLALKDDKIKKSFSGKKKGDRISLDIKKAFPNQTDLAALLKIDKEKLEEVSPHFIFEINEIKRFTEAEENQAFYDKLFEEGEVKTHEEFIKKIKEIIRKNLDAESEQRFSKDAVDKLIEMSNIPLPEAFLKRWLIKTNEGKFTPEQIEKEFQSFLKDLRWDLIRDKIADAQNIKAQEEEILDYAKNFTHAQFHQYGLGHLPEEEIEKFAREQMAKEENYRRFNNAVLDRKVIDHIKTAVKLTDKNISREAFNKLYEEEQKKEK